MGILKKGRISILVMAMLFVSLCFTEFCVSSFWEVSAAMPEVGAFHLKKYTNVSEQKKATGHKEDTNDPSNPLYGKEVISGVEYEICRTHDYLYSGWTKLDEVVAILDNGENYKTDAKGEINITDLPLGRYEFKEVSAPDGIQINPEKYYFTLPYANEDKSGLQYEVYVYPKDVRLTGSFSFQKVGDNAAEGLKNVRFAVHHEDGSPVQNAEGSDLIVTTRLSGQAEIEDLRVGKYYLLEIENPDTEYLESSEAKYWFQIYSDNNKILSKSFYTDATMENKIKDADGKDIKDGTIINYKKPSVKKTTSAKDEKDITDGLVYIDSEGNLYANVDVPYTYTITVTLPKNLAEYTKFEIYDGFTAGNIILASALSEIIPVAKGGNSQPKLTVGADFEVVQEGSNGYRLMFTKEGITALAVAKATFVEVTFDAKIPKGYKVQGNVKKGENNDAVVEFDTHHGDSGISGNLNTVYPRAGEIIVHKVDKEDKYNLLAGAEFSLKDTAGNEYWGTSHVSYLDVNGKPVSDVKEAATFIFTQLPFGTYTLKETKAPAGYKISVNSDTIALLSKEDKTVTWVSCEKYFENKKEGKVTPDTETPQTDCPTPQTECPTPQTNSSGKSSPTPSPKTGDQAPVLLYGLGLVGGCLLLMVFIYRKKIKFLH